VQQSNPAQNAAEDLFDGQIEGEEVVEGFPTDGCGSGCHKVAAIQPQSGTNLLEDEPVHRQAPTGGK
jgi:hypothetical protein